MLHFLINKKDFIWSMGGVQKPLYNWSTTPMPHKINKKIFNNQNLCVGYEGNQILLKNIPSQHSLGKRFHY